MSHPTIDISTGAITTPSGPVSARIGGCNVITTTSAIKQGKTVRRRLAASTKNPPDALGWRNPSPYSGSITTENWQKIPQDGVATSSTILCNGNLVPKVTISGPMGLASSSNARFPALNVDPMYGFDEAVADEAIQKALMGFKDMAIDLSVAFAERKQTASTVVNAIHGVTQVVRDVRRGRVPDAIKRFRTLPEQWLAYRYAWTPMVLDAYGAVEAVSRQDNGTYERYIVTKTGKAEGVALTKGAPFRDSLFSGISHGGLFRKDVTVKSQCKVRMDACITDSLYLRLQDVGVTDPLSTAWELLPYTFVVDWFLGVGDFLNGVNAMEGYRLKGGTVTRRLERLDDAIYIGVDNKVPYGKTYGLPGPPAPFTVGNRTHTSFRRSVMSGPPPSKIIVKKNPLNPTRVTDAAALLYQALTGKRR